MGKAEGPSSGDGGNAKSRRICAWAVAVALVAVALALAIAAGSGNTPEIPDSATGNKSCECLPWGQNLELLYDRVWKHPDRVRNLYFVYLFVLRAVTKVTHSNPASIVELNSPFAER
ncbi:hypothetical protein B296_00018881 [Ensete ventricosum]|uniref:Uncharacterized protein n=1 Tax=Ensete ventricosum TaxID=4639 RepID=A0A426ZMT5_ENSVE|nr:hypothetical protein B296_00018881 [Ensete ventricosum]